MPAGLSALAARVAEVAAGLVTSAVGSDATARPVLASSGMPPAPAPLERTAGSPWVWLSGQALRSRITADRLAVALAGDPDLESARPQPSGFVELTLTAPALRRMLAALATGAGLPDAVGSPPPAPGEDVVRFEAARRAGGAPPLPAPVLTRRIVANPVVAVQLAHARAVRGPGPAAFRPGPSAGAIDRQTAALITELLDAPRRLAHHQGRPREVTGALEGVAAAYLAWDGRPVGGVSGPPPHVLSMPGPAEVAAATRVVLERGLAQLGVHAPARM